MAQSKLELAVESGKWESGLKKAQSSLNNFINTQGGLGKALATNGDKMSSFIGMMGKMETTSKTAKGQINELTNSFTELSVMYNKLTNEEKNSPFGKALSSSLDQLKGRITSAKSELDQINASISNTTKGADGLKGQVSKLASAFGVNITSLTKFAGVAGVATTAMKVAKDAFLSTESGVDSWGRTLEAGKGVYESFVMSLNHGDFSSFLSNIGEVISQSKELYNTLDKLKTNTGIISNSEAMYNSERARLQKIIKDPNSTPEQIAAAKAGLKNIQKLKASGVQETMDLNNDAFKQLVYNRAREGGMTPAEFNKYKQLIYDSFYYTDKKGILDNTTVSRTSRARKELYIDENGKQAYRNATTKINIGDIFTDAFREEAAPYIRAYWGARQRMYDEERTDNRIMGGGGKTTPKVTVKKDKVKSVKAEITASYTELQVLEDQLKTVENSMKAYGETTDDWKAMNEEAKSLKAQIDKLNGKPLKLTKTESFSELQLLEDELQTVENSMKGAANAEEWAEMNEYAKSIKEQINAIAPKQVANAGKEATKAWESAASAVSSVGSALQSIENPAVKVFGIIAEAVANVARGFASSLANSKSGKLSTWEWIAEAAAGTATMISTIAAIKSATEYHAEGGVVGAGMLSRGTDTVPAMLTPGELVLTRAQTGNLASQLGGGVMRNARLETYIDGKALRIVLNNDGQYRGKGTLVMSKG